MKVVILAGGLGTRISEESNLRPKPMIEIGGKPILWHIMNVYGAHGINDFIVALGDRAEVVKAYFMNFSALNSDVSVDLTTGETVIHDDRQPHWRVHLVDTGLRTETGGRLKYLERWLGDDDSFFLTYGDCVADLDVTALLAFHRSHRKLATMTTVMSPGRVGRLRFEGDHVTGFGEPPSATEGSIDGGYFVLSREVLDYVENDRTVWERGPLERLAREGQLMGHRHGGFWSCVDTPKDKTLLEEMWASGQAPWKVWE
jgi:glucose-1-phosphate cytidylyltransferase